jgi:iron complex outermembrane receptor protein
MNIRALAWKCSTGAIRPILGLLVLAGVALAQPLPEGALEEMSLEDLMALPVYAASRRDQKISEAPSSVTVLRAREIRKYGWKTLADLLRTVQGFHVSYDRTYHWIGVRGFMPPGDSNAKILLLIDGHRLNDDIYNQAYVGEDFLLDMDLVDRVEVVRGASSSLYGSNAFLAVVNVISRRGESVEGIEASLEGEHPEGYRGRLTFGKLYGNGTDILLSASALDRPGEDLFFPEFADPSTNDGVAPGLDGVRNRRVFGSASNGAFSFGGGYVRRDKDIPTSSYGVIFPDPDSWYRDETAFMEGRYEKTHAGVEVNARIFWDWYRYDSTGTFEDAAVNPAPPFRFLMRDQADSQSWGAELRGTRTVADRHIVTAGAEYRDIFRIRQHNSVPDPATTYLDVHGDGSILGLYLQDEFRIADGLLLNAGIRHDRYSSFGGTTNPRGGLIWSPAESTALKLLYGQAFRAPTPYEMFWNDGGQTQKGNPDLKPERIRTAEAVWEQGIGENLRSTLSAYEFRIRDLVSVVNDPVDGLAVARNQGKARGRGIEAGLAGRWNDGIEGRVSGAVQRAEDEDSGERLPNSPPYTLQANAIAPLYAGKLFAGAEGQYIGRREPSRPAHATPAGGYAVFNLTIYGRELLPGVDASATLYNLLDRNYSDLGGAEHLQELIPQDGRSFRLKVTASF